MATSPAIDPNRSRWLAVCLAAAALACDTRNDFVAKICEQFQSCQFSPDTVDNVAFDACKSGINHLVDSQQLTDARLVQCKRCLDSQDCQDVYRDHKCDLACSEIDWVTVPQTSFADVTARCRDVTSACDTRPATPANEGSAGAPQCVVGRGAAAVAAAAAASGLLPESSEVVHRCQEGIQGFLWGTVAMPRAFAGAGGTSIARSNLGGASAIGTRAVAIDAVGARVVRECFSCLEAQGDGMRACGVYSSTCALKCASVPDIGSYLINSPAAHLCRAAFGSCNQFLAPLPNGIDNCVASVGDESSFSSELVVGCARGVRALADSSCSCEELVMGVGLGACGEPLKSFLFGSSPAYQVCQTATCRQNVPDPVQCLNQVELSSLEMMNQCLSCATSSTGNCSVENLGQAGAAGAANDAAGFAGASGTIPNGPCETLCPTALGGGGRTTQ